MTFPSILWLAVGLAMDATAVAAARGIATPEIRARHVGLVAGFFGGFQALMPLVGWALGVGIGPVVQAWDHWIAFGLLAALGGKMLWESIKSGDGEDADGDGYDLRTMVTLAVATSIDALAVGVTLPMLGAPFWTTIATIGVTSALLSALGLFAGRRFGALLGRRLDAVGGVALVGLGCKILVEHLAA